MESRFFFAAERGKRGRMGKIMGNERIQLVMAEDVRVEEVVDYYLRNREFLRDFEPDREAAFFTCEYQRGILEQEIRSREERSAYRFYIRLAEPPRTLIGMIGLNQVVWGAFCSAFLGYKLDREHQSQGYMTAAAAMVVQYAFEELNLHRIEANVMPRNRASLRVLEKNGFESEGISRYYLKINGVWEDHIHMVKINKKMHGEEKSAVLNRSEEMK